MCSGLPTSPGKSSRSIRPEERSPSFPPIPPLPRSTRRRANERGGATARVAAMGEYAVGGGKAAGVVGVAVRRGDPALAIRLVVFPALPVSLPDRRVLALPPDIL